MPGGESDEDADLTVIHFAETPDILSRHSGGGGPFFTKARFVHDEMAERGASEDGIGPGTGRARFIL